MPGGDAGTLSPAALAIKKIRMNAAVDASHVADVIKAATKNRILRAKTMKVQPANFAGYRWVKTHSRKQTIPLDSLLFVWAHHEDWHLLDKIGQNVGAVRVSVEALKLDTNNVDWAHLPIAAEDEAEEEESSEEDEFASSDEDASVTDEKKGPDPVGFYKTMAELRETILVSKLDYVERERIQRSFGRLSTKYDTLVARAEDDHKKMIEYGDGLNVALDQSNTFLLAQMAVMTKENQKLRDEITRARRSERRMADQIENERFDAGVKYEDLSVAIAAMRRYKVVPQEFTNQIFSVIKEAHADVHERFRVKYLEGELKSYQRQFMDRTSDLTDALTKMKKFEKQITALTKMKNDMGGEIQVLNVVNAIWNVRQDEALEGIEKLDSAARDAVDHQILVGHKIMDHNGPAAPPFSLNHPATPREHEYVKRIEEREASIARRIAKRKDDEAAGDDVAESSSSNKRLPTEGGTEDNPMNLLDDDDSSSLDESVGGVAAPEDESQVAEDESQVAGEDHGGNSDDGQATGEPADEDHGGNHGGNSDDGQATGEPADEDHGGNSGDGRDTGEPAQAGLEDFAKFSDDEETLAPAAPPAKRETPASASEPSSATPAPAPEPSKRRKLTRAAAKGKKNYAAPTQGDGEI